MQTADTQTADTQRKYKAIVTVTLMSPEGELLATEAEDAELELDMSEFVSNAEADKYVTGECSTILAAAAGTVEVCFD